MEGQIPEWECLSHRKGEKTTEQATLSELLSALCDADSIAEAGASVVENVARAFELTWLVAYRLGEDMRLLLLGTFGSFPDEQPDSLEPGEGPLGRAFATGRTGPLPGSPPGFIRVLPGTDRLVGVLGGGGGGEDVEVRLEAAAGILSAVIRAAALREEVLRERDQALAELAHARRIGETKDRFISAVSHEFRTPLTSIRSFSEILLSHSPDDVETTREFLSIIHEESVRLTRLVNNLLDLSRIEAGKMEWDFAENDLSDAIRRATRAVASIATEKEVEVHIEVASDVGPFSFDRDKIVQVLVNLVSNAIKYSPPGGGILVSAYLDEEGTVIRIRDEGPGIREEDRSRIFDRFSRVGDPQAQPGTGLGLSISREIVLAHGGRIWVEGAPEGGSDFLFRLPAAPPGAARPESDAPVPPSSPPTERGANEARLLVIDGDPAFLRFLAFELKKAGFQCSTEGNGVAGIHRARSDPPDAVLLADELPDLSGEDVLAVLRTDPVLSKTPVFLVMSSGRSRPPRGFPEDRIVRKPVDGPTFTSQITRLLPPAKE